MNIMRKLRAGVSSVSPISSGTLDDTSSSSPHNQLGLMHLKKLFSEYNHPNHPLTEKEKDDKLYNMLPLFCKVFGSNPSSDMNEKFWDIMAFCQQVSLLMVNEIRKRASNQSTEAASCAIAKFLEIENCEESSNGWMLLSTLNLLASGDMTLIQVMSEVSVPSTLVKCLYLFFDLPEMNEKDSNTKETNSDFTPRERRILLQKIFVQLLVRLCGHKIPAEELARKDDLTLLFSAITSWCPSYNTMWRKSAAEVLMTLSRHGLTPPVVGYIHSKGCVALCIDNMKRVPELAPLEIVEMFVTIFCFLKDSSDVSSVLLDDFRQAQGYPFLSDFLLKLENEKLPEAQESIRNLVLMVTSLCMCGYIELKPSKASAGSLFQMQGFVLPQPSGHGASVRNIQAFHVLQSTFVRSSSTILLSTILDAISSIYHSDSANYFILENQNTLSQFTEKIHTKPTEIQEKLFKLIEFLVFNLNFVPCKELISMSIFLKTHSLNHPECSILCLQTLLNILKHNSIFKEVYREVGMLEVFVTCLRRYANFLEEKKLARDNSTNYDIPGEQEKLGNLVVEALTSLLSGNSSNATVLRECGGSKIVHSLVQYQECKYQALGIIRELVLTTGGDDDMTQILQTLQSAPSSFLQLKIDILEALRLCLKESHRTRTVFRKVDGFMYVSQVILTMKGKFLQKEDYKQEFLQLLHLIFQTINIAMRFEPANAKFFHDDLCKSCLCDLLRCLGCFSTTNVGSVREVTLQTISLESQDMFYNIFIGNVVQTNIPDDIPAHLFYSTIIYRHLYDLALDLYDKPNSGVLSIKSPSLSRQSSCEPPTSSTNINRRSNISSLNLNPPVPDPIIVHPGVVVVMLQLLPCIEDEETEMGLSLQLLLAEIIKSLVRSERNQQVMCDKGLVSQIISLAAVALQNENHPLHTPIQYILERLAAQAMEPINLRQFLRLGNPLNCLPLEQREIVGGPVPLTRIKTLVSMTTPKDFRAQSSHSLPPFVEFDMSAEGFGCLYLPSIAPQSPATSSVVSNADTTVLGGIGAGDRIFPPQTGLSYSTWICVDKFSDPRTDPHCVRLLTLVRTFNGARDDHLVCLSVVLSARDKAIIVSTQETHIPSHVGEWEPEGSGEHGARVWCPDILHEGQWHHIVVVLNRAVLKNSSFSLYLDGQQLHSQKMHYISQNPGGGSSNMAVYSSVYGYIGTPPAWRRYSKLCWKQGPCHLFEEVLTPLTVTQMYQLGPHYMGSFLAPNLNNSDNAQLVTEEKVTFGVNAKAVSLLTLNKIRKVYSRTDNKSIAKQLGMSSHESATPIRILHNSAGHLGGSARTLGGVVIGYLGVRVFCPRPVAVTIDAVGGCAVLLGLIAMAQDIECLYAGVKALVCVVRSNKVAQNEMDRKRGYQTLAMLLRRKKSLLNSHILHLTFSLVGTIDSGRESSAIPNRTAFQDLLCDLEVWHEAPGELLKSHLEHLYELAAESSEKRTNVWIMKDLNLVEKLLHIILDIQHQPTKQILFSLLSVLLSGQPRQSDLLIFGQFLCSTIPQSSSPSEKCISLQEQENTVETECITLRNKCLSILHSMIFAQRNAVSEEISKTLGFDWIILFMQPHLHSSTVVWGLRILVAMCANPTLMIRFREGSCNGGWLRHIEQITHNKMAVILGVHHVASYGNDSKSEGLHIPGFRYLEWLLPAHLEVSEVYFLLTALMMGQPIKMLPSEKKFDLDTVWAFLWGSTLNNQPISTIAPRVNLCQEAIVVLLSMARHIIHSDVNTLPEWLQNHTISIIQVLFQLYHNMPEVMPIFMSSEVLSALASVLFPLPPSLFDSSEDSGSSTPAGEEVDGIVVVPKTPIEEEALTTHPARQFIMDFIRVIIVDSLSLSNTGKTSPVIDLALDAFPRNSTPCQQTCYQTDVLVILMDHLLAADMLVGDQAAIPIVPLPNAHIQHIAPNVFYLTARIVDKLWMGSLHKDPHDVFDFIIKLIGQAKRRTGNLSLECLYHCLNKCILFLLSRSTETIADQMSVLEALHKLTNNRLIIFGAGNHELDFIGCLTYCLLQLTADMRVMLETNIKTTWHVNPSSDLESRDECLNNHQSRNLMAGAALRVWEELYVCKKPAIEEVFKVTLATPGPNQKAPDLTIVRDQVFESSTKLWINYVEMEGKATYRVPWELHNQIQSKIHKVTGGLTRLASRTKVRKEETLRIKVRMGRKEALQWMINHVELIRELIEMRRQQHQNTTQHTQRYVHQEWLQTENELTRERGLWGPLQPCHLDKWMLDMTEGPNRMRKKTMKNDLFYLHYPYRPEHDKGALKYKVATSNHSKEYYYAVQAHQQYSISGLSEPERSDSLIEEPSPSPLPLTTLPPLTRLKSDPEEGQDDNDTEEELPSIAVPDNQTLMRLLEENEKITYMFRCARIQGLDTTEGLLLFGQEHCYVVDGFTLLKNREIKDIESVSSNENEYEPILPNPGSPRRSRAMRQCSRFSYDDIREVHKRRYLLQPMALEVFSGDGRNYLLAFPRKSRNKVYQRFMASATGISDSAQQSVAGQKRTANVEQASGLLSNLIGETTVTQRWVRGEISNFQYLMYLNTLAGRSYNDLMQYPVFPWILADYDTEELDLTHPSTFRDFTKPMGAQSPERLEQFKKRFKEWDDPHGETPPYHYGTHYSSAMIVCSYLVRIEPFTQHFLKLQGGHFDLADRMFHSVKEAWLSASKHNMADVKELIPEFFYLPEFLENSNQFDLGVKQNGVALGDVVLPPWAKQDTREFIRVHRLALECDYVSQNLHHWIDLIFGYKQHGQPAIDAVNVFHHLFYEGNVDIYNIDDPLKKNATIGFINNFGQIPKQLFKKPHPFKKMGNNYNNRNSVIDTSSLVQAFSVHQQEKLFFHHLDNLRPSLQPIKEVKSPVGQILHVDKTILAVEQNKVLIPPTYNKYVAWGFADHSLRIGNYESDKAVFVCESAIQNNGEILACVTPSARLIVTAGTSTVITVWEYEARKKSLNIKYNLYGHTDAVTCLAASPAYNVIISGSRDCTAIVWDLSRGMFVRQLTGHAGPIAAVAVNDLTGDIATCAATWLHIWTINGDEVASVNTCVGRADRMQQILCVAFSQTHEWDPMNVIMTGSTDGVTRMWCIDYVQVPNDDTNQIFKESLKEMRSVDNKPKPINHKLVKQINVSNESSCCSLMKSGSESSLSEDNNSRKIPKIVNEEKTSKEWRNEQQNEKDTCSDTEEATPLSPPIPARRRRSRIHGGLRKSEGGSSTDNNSLEVDEGSGIRTSKSDTSLTDSFVIIPETKKKAINPLNILRPGHKWQRQLVFRSKLTMHTAYDRKDNTEPASITALAVSKDHRTVYVGDTRGRVFSWSVTEQPGRGAADHWLKDEGADYCANCSIRFTIYERKHHCRNCGQVFCSKCSRFESEISRLRILKPVRVCQNCFATLKQAG